MTAHGPAAIALVKAALDDAGVAALPAPMAVATVTGTALDVVAGTMNRDAAIDTLAYRWTVEPRQAAKLLDLAVEALTANTQE